MNTMKMPLRRLFAAFVLVVTLIGLHTAAAAEQPGYPGFHYPPRFIPTVVLSCSNDAKTSYVISIASFNNSGPNGSGTITMSGPQGYTDWVQRLLQADPNAHFIVKSNWSSQGYFFTNTLSGVQIVSMSAQRQLTLRFNQDVYYSSGPYW